MERRDGLFYWVTLPAGTVRSLLAVCAGYYVAGVLSLIARFPSSGISTVWLATPVLLAAFLVVPPATWWMYCLALVPVHLHLVSTFQGPVPLPVMFVQLAGNCAHAMLAAAVLRKLIGTGLRLDGLRNMSAFIVVAGFASPWLVSAVVVYLFQRLEWTPDFWLPWRARSLSNGVAGLIATPLILWGITAGVGAVRTGPWRRYAEFAVLIAALTALCIAVFGDASAGPGGRPALLYAPLPLLLWASVRFGTGGLCVSLLVVAIQSLSNAMAGRGPFILESPVENVLGLQLFLIAMAVPLLLLSALLEQHDDTVDALRKSEAVVESQTDLVCRYRADTTLTFVNEACCRYFGKERSGLIGRKFLELLSSSGQEAMLRNISLLSEKQGVSTVEHDAALPGGGTAWLQWTSYVVLAPDGSIAEFQGIGRDITDKKMAEDAQRNLTHASRLAAVGELTALVAHEVNQPLAAILRNAEAGEELLKSESPRMDELRDILSDIRHDDLRASETIHRVRGLVQKHEVKMQELNLNELVSDVIRLAASDALRRHVRIEEHLDPEIPLIQGDRIHLEQVILNLMLNGMDAMMAMPEERRRLTLQTSRSGSSGVELAVFDTGQGIPAEILPAIFNSFFTTKKEGTGLGLSIVRSILQRHSGRIRAENNPSGGAVFRVELPCLASDRVNSR